MKREQSLAPISSRSRTIILTALIVFACFASVRAQDPSGTVIPRVCVETSYYTGTVTLVSAAAAGNTTINVNGTVPPLVALVINPGGATEERVPFISLKIDGSNPYTLSMHNELHNALNPNSFGSPSGATRNLVYAHNAGEPVRFEGYSGRAYFGYNNTTAINQIVPRGVSSGNYFSPGPTLYQLPQHPNTFTPGIHDNILSVLFGGQLSDTLSWHLNGNVAVARNRQGCATITYQGRLSDQGASANGQYDLRFTAFDALNGGAAQSDVVTIENAQVTNGAFTVQLNFGSSFFNHNKAHFLEIAVRAGASTGTFTVLTPRQPITDVPFAVNAQFARSVSGGFVQVPLVTAPLENTPADGCGISANFGNLKVDATNNRLYICTVTGWKSVVLQ